MKAEQFLQEGINFLGHGKPSRKLRGQFQDLLTTTLTDHQPLHVRIAGAHGDKTIHWWAFHTMFERKCQQIGVDPSQAQVRPYKNAPHSNDGLDISHHINSVMGLDGGHWHARFLDTLLLVYAYAFNVDLELADFIRPPQPLPANFAPLNTFSRPLVTEIGEILRAQHQLQAPRTIVIGQSGAHPCKRLADIQVKDIASVVRKAAPDSQIVVLSDKNFVRSEVQETDANPPKPISNDPLDTFFFVRNAFTVNNDLRAEVFSDLVVRSADQVVMPRSLNEVCAHLYAADMFVGTDSFWGWLAAGCKAMRPERNGFIHPEDVMLLYTVADPRVWAVPEIKTVESKAINPYRIDGYLPNNGVLMEFRYHTQVGILDQRKKNKPYPDYDYFISSADIRQLRRAIRSHFRN